MGVTPDYTGDSVSGSDDKGRVDFSTLSDAQLDAVTFNMVRDAWGQHAGEHGWLTWERGGSASAEHGGEMAMQAVAGSGPC